MRNFNSGERINSGDFVSLDLRSEENGGSDNGVVVDGGSHVGFSSGFFGGNESRGFRGNIGEHSSGDFSGARLGFEDPSVDTGSGANSVFFVSGHASLSGFAPTAVNIGSAEITVLDSQTEFVVVHFREFAGVFVSDGGVDSVPELGVGLFSVGIGNNGIFRNQSGLGSIRRSIDFSAKVVG